MRDMFGKTPLADDLKLCCECGKRPRKRIIYYMVLCAYDCCQRKRNAICWKCIRNHYALHQLAGDHMEVPSIRLNDPDRVHRKGLKLI
jgi:hypothetical protein